MTVLLQQQQNMLVYLSTVQVLFFTLSGGVLNKDSSHSLLHTSATLSLVLCMLEVNPSVASLRFGAEWPPWSPRAGVL